MTIWERLPIIGARGGLWDKLEKSLPEPAELGSNGGVWGQLTIPPGGLWRDLQDDTLILRPPDKDLWVMTTNLPRRELRGRVSIWDRARAEDTLSPDETVDASLDLWDKLDDETLIVKKAGASVFHMPAVRDLGKFKPMRAPGYALKELKEAGGKTYFVLKNLRTDAFMRLDEHQRFLWDLLDGAHNVQDLAVASFMQFGTFNVAWLEGFLGQLQSRGFLVQESVDPYQGASAHIERRTLWYWVKRAGRLLFQSELDLPVEKFYKALYRAGWCSLYNPVMQILMGVIVLAGIPAYLLIVQRSGLNLLGGTLETAHAGGLVGLIVAQIIIFFVHESAHALTTVNYGREVRRGGVGLYFGMLSFFMDTTDIWMEPRGPRLAVTWAGPYSGFVLGSIASILLIAAPEASWAGFLFQFATLGYWVSLTNLNPLIKLDGYYLLMDWLEMPMLRERSIKFVRSQLREKIQRRERLTRDEWIFAVFGVLAIAFTGVMVYLIATTYGKPLFDLTASLFKTQ